MTWGRALGAAFRSAALFAVVYVVATALLDLWLVGGIDWREQARSTLIVVPVYWILIAWMRKRRSA